MAMEALAMNETNRLENEQLEQRIVRMLSSKAIPLSQRVRMAAAIGVMTEVFVESGAAFDDVGPEELGALVRQIVEEVLAVPAGT